MHISIQKNSYFPAAAWLRLIPTETRRDRIWTLWKAFWRQNCLSSGILLRH